MRLAHNRTRYEVLCSASSWSGARPSLIDEVTDSVVAPAVKKRFLSAPYVPIRRYLGCYQVAFENGVVLGYAFGDRLTTFARLFSQPGREQELTTFMQGLAETMLAKCREAETFIH